MKMKTVVDEEQTIPRKTTTLLSLNKYSDATHHMASHQFVNSDQEYCKLYLPSASVFTYRRSSSPTQKQQP